MFAKIRAPIRAESRQHARHLGGVDRDDSDTGRSQQPVQIILVARQFSDRSRSRKLNDGKRASIIVPLQLQPGRHRDSGRRASCPAKERGGPRAGGHQFGVRLQHRVDCRFAEQSRHAPAERILPRDAVNPLRRPVPTRNKTREVARDHAVIEKIEDTAIIKGAATHEAVLSGTVLTAVSMWKSSKPRHRSKATACGSILDISQPT
ncbi:hypothetical protein AAIH46_06890 [Rhizobium sp. 0TCS1.26]